MRDLFFSKTFQSGSDESRSLDAAIRAGKIDFQVGLEPIYLEDPNELGGIREIDGQKAIVRQDNRDVFGVASNGWTFVHAREALGLVQPLLDSGEAEIISVGGTSGGRKVYVQAQIRGGFADVTPGDTLQQHVVFASGNDGSLSVRAGYTAIRIVCQNTMMMAAQSAAFKAKHTKGVHSAIQGYTEEFQAQRDKLKTAAELFRSLTKRKLSDRNLNRFIRETLSPGAGNDDAIAVRGVERIVELAHEAPGAQPGTLWGGLNAVTYWATHERGRSENARREALMFGQGGQLIERAVAVAVQYADKLPSNELGREAYANHATAKAELGALLGRPARIASELDG